MLRTAEDMNALIATFHTVKLKGKRRGIRVKGHPKANSKGYIFFSRFIMELYLGRYLESNETVHHENEIVDDDRFENLKLISGSLHNSIHKRKMNYSVIWALRNYGFSYGRIAKQTGYNAGSIPYVCQQIGKVIK